MTPYQRAALGCRLAALAATGGVAAAATEQQWVPAAGLLWGGFLLAFVGGCCQQAHLSIRATHERARRAALTDTTTLDIPVPCCSVWRHTGGALHDPTCTRPAAARRDDYRLNATTANAFDEITAHFDDQHPA